VAFIICLPSISFAKVWTENFFPIIQCKNLDSCTFDDAVGVVNRMINWFISIAATLGAVNLAYCGIRILLNPGSESEITDSKKMFWKTLWGLFWLLAAWVIVYTIVNTFVDGKTDALRFLKQK